MNDRSSSNRKGISVAIALLLVGALGAWMWPASTLTTGDVLVVSINAQPHVKPGFCTAYANVYGGTGPYEYEWTGLFEGDDLYEQAYLTSSGSVYLTVTDANLAQGSDQMDITVDANGHDCGI